MSIDKITKTNFVPTKLPTRVPAEKVNEIIDAVNALQVTVAEDFPSTITVAADTDALIIDATTTDHTGDALIDIDADIDPTADFNAINVNIDVAVALGGTEDIAGVRVTTDGLAADANGSTINGFVADLTSPTTSRADITGLLIGIDSVRSTDDTDNGVIVGFTGTMNSASAGTYGIRLTTESFTHTNGNYYGYYELLSHTVTAGASYAGYWLADVTAKANPHFGLFISKDLINNAASGALAQTNSGLYVTQATASLTAASGATTVANATAYIEMVNTAALATADVWSGKVLSLKYSAETTGAGTATNTACGLFLDYDVTATAGTLSATAFNVAYIDFDGSAVTCAAGTYNLFYINGTTATTFAYAASVTLNGMSIDLTAMDVSDVDLTLTGLRIANPAVSTSATIGVAATSGSVGGYLAYNASAGFFTDGTQSISIAQGTAHLSSTTTMITDMPVSAVGAGFDTALGVKHIPYGKRGVAGMTVTEIYVDLHAAAVTSKNTDLDVIGEAAGGAAYIAQITAANHGTVVGMTMTCIEVPATGDDDINLISSTAATAVYDDLGSGLAGYALLLDTGGAWTLGLTKGIVTYPAANSYLYLTSGNGDTAGAYSAGKFLITIYGV